MPSPVLPDSIPHRYELLARWIAHTPQVAVNDRKYVHRELLPARWLPNRKSDMNDAVQPRQITSEQTGHIRTGTTGRARRSDLGESAATAAIMAIDSNQDVQQVNYAELRRRLLAAGQILSRKAARGIKSTNAV